MNRQPAEASSERTIPFYENDYFAHNLRTGTLFNRSGTKMCYLPSELLLSLKQVMEEEIGDSWRQVVYRVGRIWGRRVARRLQKELTDFYNRPLHEMPVREFTAILEGYFRYHGWGDLRLELAHAHAGYIVATLENGAFVEVVGAGNGPVDSIVCGLLSEFLCQISERTDIDCVETECAATGRPRCTFILGIESRLGTVRRMVEEGRQHEEILGHIVPPLGKDEISDSDTQQSRQPALL